MTSTEEALALTKLHLQSQADRIVLRCLLLRLEGAFPGILAATKKEAEMNLAQITEGTSLPAEIAEDLKAHIGKMLDTPT